VVDARVVVVTTFGAVTIKQHWTCFTWCTYNSLTKNIKKLRSRNYWKKL
jgi:hypothetical protein